MNTSNQATGRSSNKWTALVLFLIALAFFGGVIANRWYFG